jgi:glycosyl transferase, family 25
MEIYYINLDERPDRREFMETQFARLGLSATRIEAVTPNDLSAGQLAVSPLFPRALSCRLSNLAAARAVVDSGAPYGLILEDDVALSRQLPAFLEAFELAGDIHLLRLETSLGGVRYRSIERTIGPCDIVRPLSWEGGSGCYIISAATARMLVDKPNLQLRDDELLFNPFGTIARRAGLRQTIPALAVQTDRYNPVGMPRLGSNMSDGPQVPQRVRTSVQRLWDQMALVWQREIVDGGQRTLHQLRGARKTVIPFLE